MGLCRKTCWRDECAVIDWRMFSLGQKTAVITGAGSGSGKAIALLFGKQGAHVEVLDLNEVQAKEVAAEIVAAGGSAEWQRCDIGDGKNVKAVMAAIVSAEWGIALDQRVVCIGEVGLTGAFRPVSAMERRLREAARIGLTTMVVPPGTPIIDGATRIEVATVAELLGAVRSLAAPQAPARERRPEEGW